MSRPAHSRFVYLASASPRRQELLASIGVRWQILVADIVENVLPGETPAECVRRLALAKAASAAHGLPAGLTAPVIGADTVVAVDGALLGKPRGRADAERMLRLLSGRTHEVWSGVVVISAAGAGSVVSRTEVSFREITEAEIAAYWDTGEPADKAGAYAIQGRAAVFVSGIRGSYSGVVGLPLFETADLLSRHGMAVLSLSGE